MRLNKHKKTRPSKDFPAEKKPASSLTSPRFIQGVNGLMVWTDIGGYKYITEVNPYFLYHLQEALGEQGKMETAGYKAVMVEIQRRADSGTMYPNKGEQVA